MNAYLEYELHTKRQTYDRKARGEIIYAAVTIEGVIEQIIAEHFSEGDKRWLFISLMFTVGQVTFSQNLIMLKKLFLNSYPDFLALFPGMFNQINKLRDFRNKLAHTKVDLSYGLNFIIDGSEIDELPTGISLEYFKDSKVVREFITPEKIDKTLAMAQAYLDILGWLEMEVKNRSERRNNQNFKAALRELRSIYYALSSWRIEVIPIAQREIIIQRFGHK